MGRTEGRTAQDTRRLILEAAARAIRRDGLAASLDTIAVEAGISKGGLTYHYRSKQALLLALGAEVSTTFRQHVDDQLSEEDRAPGRLARAYIRASFAEARHEALRDNIVLAAHLMSDSELQPIAEEDGHYWRAALEGDGLPALTIKLIVAATDGVNTGPLWGSVLDPSDVDDIEQALLEMTHMDPDQA